MPGQGAFESCIKGLQKLDGMIDEFRIYHKALSSDERTQNYNHGAFAHGKTVIEE